MDTKPIHMEATTLPPPTNPQDHDLIPRAKRMHPDSKLPVQSSPGAAGYDLFAVAPALVRSGGWTQIRTGVAVAIPRGLVGLIRTRSSLGIKQGVLVFEGTVDCDYRGELIVMARTITGESYTVRPGDRVAQLVLVPYLQAPMQWTTELDATERGDGALGSTGR